MREYGIKLTTANSDIIKELYRFGKKTCEWFAGKLIPEALIRVVTEEIGKHRESILVNAGEGKKNIKGIKYNTGY